MNLFILDTYHSAMNNSLDRYLTPLYYYLINYTFFTPKNITPVERQLQEKAQLLLSIIKKIRSQKCLLLEDFISSINEVIDFCEEEKQKPLFLRSLYYLKEILAPIIEKEKLQKKIKENEVTKLYKL